MSLIRVLDFESSHDTPEEGGLCELAYTDLVSTGTDLAGEPIDWEVGETKSRLANPGVPIPPETAAIHHIIDDDVAGEPNWMPLLASLVKKALEDKVDYFAAHGAKFELKWIHPDFFRGQPPIQMLDTYKAALRVYKESPVHSNMGLRYHLRHEGIVREKALPAHRAGPDSYATAFNLCRMLNDGTPVQQILEWSLLPALTIRCKIGSARNDGKGTLWEDVDDGLLHWILGKDFDEDTVYTVRHHLALRADASALDNEQAELDEQFRANGMQPSRVTPVAPDPNQREMAL